MSKILKRLPQLVLIIVIFSLFLPKATLAANCTFTYYNSTDLSTPISPNQNMDNLSVNITSNELRSGTYRVQLIRANNSTDYIRDINFTSGTATVTTNKPIATGWLAGVYKIYFIEQEKTGNPQDIAACQTSFTITDIPISSSCTASIATKPIDPDTPVELVINGISSGTYDIFINNELKFTNSMTTSNTRLALGSFNVGTYTVTIKKDSRLQCTPVSFGVAARGSGGGGQVDTVTGITPANNKCDPKNPSYDAKKCTKGGGEPCDVKRGPAFKTAIGCINTNPTEFIKDFLTFILGISGGLAFLLMLLGVFQMLTSAGNPETLSAGRDRLQSAVIGLLFVIFAVLLLRIIGVDILGLGGQFGFK